MKRRTKHPRGYILLLTLLMLAIAAAALAGICRAGLQSVVRASGAQEDLQRRWGVISCRAALFGKSPAVLAAPGRRGPLAEATVSFRLGGQPTTLVFGDEQAKANVNLMYALGQRAGADRAVRALAQSSGAAVRVELRPMVVDADEDVDTNEAVRTKDRGEPEDEAIEVSFEPAFESWGQVFADASPHELMRSRGTLPSVASNLTCWGDGTINVLRASREAMLNACDRVLGPAAVTKLLAARDKDPEFDLWETLDMLNLPEARRDAADLLLSDDSTCYSMWIVTRSGSREWYDLTVGDVRPGGTGAKGELRTFSW